MELELVSFELCPYAQRCIITLRHQGIDHKTTSIDLDDPPQWFRDISPLGKVPVLRVSDGETEEVLFESAAINEFIDDITGNAMMPTDPVQKALHRGWIEVASECLSDVRAMSTAADVGAFEAARARLEAKLGQMEARFGGGPFWSGPDFRLIDAAVAPLWVRLDALEEVGITVLDSARYPRLATYAQALMALPEVQESLPEDFAERIVARLAGHGGHMAALVTA